MKLEVNKFKPLIGIEVANIEYDDILTFILENVEETILNYCNLRKLPDGLTSTAYRMAMDIYRNEQFGIGNMDSQVSSIEEGDTKVSFGSSPYNSNFTDSILKNYTAQLNRYRRLLW